MASYHCTVKVGFKGKGASASAHAAYILRQGKYALKEDIVAGGSMNMPAWAAHDPQLFWEASDEHERERGSTYREFELALPRELTPAQRVALVEDFIGSSLGGRHVVQWAIHCPRAALDGGEQPHAHIMYSERRLDEIKRDPEQFFKRWNAKLPDRGGCQKDSAGTEDRLQLTRKLWEVIQNGHLERYGHDARVDHRSLEEQGRSDELPEVHFGRQLYALESNEREQLMEMRAARTELREARAEIEVVQSEVKLEADQEKVMCEQRERIAELRRQQAKIEAQHQAERDCQMEALNKERDALCVDLLNDVSRQIIVDKKVMALRNLVSAAQQQVDDSDAEINALINKGKDWKRKHPFRAFFRIGASQLVSMRAQVEAELNKQALAEADLEQATQTYENAMLAKQHDEKQREQKRAKLASLESRLKNASSAVIGSLADAQLLIDIAAQIKKLEAQQEECLRKSGGVCTSGDDGLPDQAMALVPEPTRKKRPTLVIEYLPAFFEDSISMAYAINKSLQAMASGPFARLDKGLYMTTDRKTAQPDVQFAHMQIFNNDIPANLEPEKRLRIEIQLGDVPQDEASLYAHIEHELREMRDELLVKHVPELRQRKEDHSYESPTPFGM
jgi:hypothetical protein